MGKELSPDHFQLSTHFPSNNFSRAKFSPYVNLYEAVLVVLSPITESLRSFTPKEITLVYHVDNRG